LKLHKTRFQFDPKYLFDQWLFVIARSVMLDYLKQKKRYETHIINEDPSEIADPLSQMDHPHSYTQVEMPEVAGLSKEQKEVLMLKVMDDLTYREIAEKLKRTEVGVRQIFSRAIKKLKMMRKEEAK
jgi:RNA polymerase sigma-70 factor (ECF subfamily)